MRVAIYTRVSTEEQAADDKLSLEDQEKRCREWCTEHDHIVVAVFSDPGVSGGTLDRPGLKAALAAAQRGECDILLAKRVDRLTRDMDHVGWLATTLRASNVALKFVSEDFGLGATGKLTRTISAYGGEGEREKFRERGTVGRLARARAGKSNATTPPYGYRRDVTLDSNGKKVFGPIVIDEYEADQLRRMFDWYLDEDVSLRQIAVRLNKAKVPMKLGGGKGWLVESVRRLMINERYIGKGWQNMTREYRNGTYERVPREEWLPISFPPLIDAETFQRTQERIATNRPFRKASIGEARHLVQGLGFCAECGHRLQCSSARVRGVLRPIYLCAGQMRRGYDCRRPLRVDGAALDEAVWRQIVHACRNPDLWVGASAAADREACLLGSDVEALIRDLERKLANEDARRNRLAAAVADGTFKPGDRSVVTVLTEIADRVDAWEHELRRHKERQGEYQALAMERVQAEALASEIGPSLDGMVLTEKQKLLRALVRRVWLDKVGNVTIEAALPYLERGKEWRSTVSQRADSSTSTRPSARAMLRRRASASRCTTPAASRTARSSTARLTAESRSSSPLASAT